MRTYFVSYTGSNADVAGNIAAALLAEGFDVRLAATDLDAGDKFIPWMQAATAEAHVFVAVCSPDYFGPNAPYAKLERDAAIARTATDAEFRLVPIKAEPCDLPPFMSDTVFFDLAVNPLEDFIAREVRRYKKQSVRTGGRAGLMIGVPSGRQVIGREAELEALRRELNTEGEVQVTNSGAILSGQGGIGKTTLARAYAEAHRAEYDGVLWTLAATRQDVIDGLMGLCGPLGLAVPDPAKEAHAQAVLAKLAESGKRWLLIYDNVEGYDGFRGLESRGCHLIVTTRQGTGWPGFAVLPTDVLDFATEDGAAVRLLMQTAEKTEGAAEARALAEVLGGLPLALVMAGRLIAREGRGFADYLADVSEIIARAPRNEDYPSSVIGAVEMSYKLLSEDAKWVADLFAWWAPEGLEPELISGAPEGQWWETRKDELPEAVLALAADGPRVRAAVAELVDRSLIARGEDGAEMHRMTAAALRALQAGRGAGEAAGTAAVLLAAVYPGGERGVSFSENWPLCRRLTPHVRALWASGAAPRRAAMGTLLNQSALYLGKIADYTGGVEMARAALALKQERLPEEDREIALGLANLGGALRRIGDLQGARTHLDQAIALDQAHRPGSADLADSYDLQGGVLVDIGRGGDAGALDRAAKRRQQALALRRNLFGRRSDPVAQALNNLGTVRDAQGRTAAAARLSAASLAIRRAVLPPGDARLGYGLLNTGAMYVKAGQADRAEPLLDEALALWRAVYGDLKQPPGEFRATADWLVSCLLVRARAGENAGLREARARRLCDEFGLEWAEAQAKAARYPYAGAAG